MTKDIEDMTILELAASLKATAEQMESAPIANTAEREAFWKRTGFGVDKQSPFATEDTSAMIVFNALPDDVKEDGFYWDADVDNNDWGNHQFIFTQCDTAGECVAHADDWLDDIQEDTEITIGCFSYHDDKPFYTFKHTVLAPETEEYEGGDRDEYSEMVRYKNHLSSSVWG